MMVHILVLALFLVLPIGDFGVHTPAPTAAGVNGQGRWPRFLSPVSTSDLHVLQ